MSTPETKGVPETSDYRLVPKRLNRPLDCQSARAGLTVLVCAHPHICWHPRWWSNSLELNIYSQWGSSNISNRAELQQFSTTSTIQLPTLGGQHMPFFHGKSVQNRVATRFVLLHSPFKIGFSMLLQQPLVLKRLWVILALLHGKRLANTRRIISGCSNSTMCFCCAQFIAI